MPIDVVAARLAGRPRGPGALGAAEACREVIAAYFHLSDSGDLEAQAEVFSRDIELGHGDTGTKGKAAVTEFLRSRRKPGSGRKTVHLLGSVQITHLSDRAATSFAQFSFYDNQVGEQQLPGGMRFLGLYESHDGYLLEDGVWKLARHHANPLGTAP